MSKAPPMNGKEGTSPNVGNSVARPLSPLEHATVSIEPPELSNLRSNVARKEQLNGGQIGQGVPVVDVVTNKSRYLCLWIVNACFHFTLPSLVPVLR